MNTKTTAHTNLLVNETSPYLLQHAHNPVNWYPWGQEAFDKAKKENKPVLISIGYSSCHWCHVMERESFENEQLAEIMNTHFICIKVDREERPDVDQIYMEAVQALGLGGGWPLNAFVTPEGKPFYGGTYFPPNKWEYVLKQLSDAYQTKKEKIANSSEEVTQSLQTSEVKKYGLNPSAIFASTQKLDEVFSLLQKNFDKQLGGMDKEPKFPMPSIYTFLNRYYALTKNPDAFEHVNFTLEEMAKGGIYDQIGGGFSRYSVDAEWFAPHFEKMLYDNGQLLSLYAEAYTINRNPEFLTVIEETCDWLQREMLDPSGGFYSALDADSEGEEGKFYIWTYDELQELLQQDLELFSEFYGIKPGGNWEQDYNILHRSSTILSFCEKKQLQPAEFTTQVQSWKTILLNHRDQRIRPGLDDKILAGWNGLTLSGLADAYKATNNPIYLELAFNCAKFLRSKMIKDGVLYHSYKNDHLKALAFLDDYAAVIEGFIKLYQVSFEESWLIEAKALSEYVIDHFYDDNEEMFYFTSDAHEKLITRKKEVFDNVISSSNSIMATNLFILGKYFDRSDFLDISSKMLGRASKMIFTEPSYTANWASLLSYHHTPIAEVALVGEELDGLRKTIEEDYFPHKIMMGTPGTSAIPLLADKKTVKPTVFVCRNKTCGLPVTTAKEALDQIKTALQPNQ